MIIASLEPKRRGFVPWLRSRRFVALVLLLAAQLNTAPSIRAQPVKSQAFATQKEPTGRFEKVDPSESGIYFVPPLLLDHPKDYLYYSGFACGGIAIGDLNGDRVLDIFISSGPAPNQLFLQSASKPFQFTVAPPSAGIAGGDSWGSGVSLIDIDQDHDLDIYLTNYDSPNQLFINHTTSPAQPRFVESAAAYGLDLSDASLMPAFGDYDRDGDLDVYILNNQYYRPTGRPQSPPFKIVQGRPQVLPEFSKYYRIREPQPGQFTMDSYGRPDRLLVNRGPDRSGQIRFEDATESAGIEGTGHGLSVTWWDFNNDQYPDLYIGNDFTDPDRLYRNNGDGTFTEVLGDTLPYCSWSSMGATSADFNNDGHLDFFSADMAATTHFDAKVNMGDMSKHRWLMENGWPRQIMRNMLYVNTGTDRFLETAWMSGVAQSDWTWAAKAGDLDGDGWVDLFLTNGMVRNFSDADIPFDTGMLIGRTIWDIYEPTPPLPQENMVFQNEGDLQFRKAAEWGLNESAMSYASALGDLDQDGDLDLVVINLDDPISLYRNEISTRNQIVFRLRGSASNTDGFGARLTIETPAGRQIRYFNPINGFQSCNAPEIHFGLGEESIVNQLWVDWPSGTRQSVRNLSAGRRYLITEPATPLATTPPRSKPATQFTEVSHKLGLNFQHRERRYDDYQRQPLLPAKLSQEGPGMAWADADGDGRDECFVGGAAGQSGGLYRRNPDGHFGLIKGPWQNDAQHEDMGCLWLDVDRDGDLDLYVGSGGVEGAPGADVFRDRIYLNQGNLRFTKADPKVLPHGAYATSTVVATDYDGDGDLDLFVGTRSTPGKFPLFPKSHLLLNESDVGRPPHFRDVTNTLAPGLSQVGLVTGAVWSDIDQDGKPDLLVTCEWGPIRAFLNRAGRLEDQSDAAGLLDHSGWWHSITAADLDNDGDTDYIATNAGINTKYGIASKEKPASLFYGDMDGTGQPHLVEAKPGDKTILPIRGLSCSSTAMPALAEKFSTFRSFAAAGLVDIYTPKRLNEAHQYTASTFESGILWNETSQGKVKFRWAPLPWLAQSSPGYGIAVTDVDADGQQDIFIVGNSYTREPETSLWRGNPGILLKGTPNGEFKITPWTTSGLLAPNDTKSLAVVNLNGDPRPDFVATENNGQLLAFANNQENQRTIAVRLAGPKGNPSGVGARIQIRFDDGTMLTQEIFAGSGYLSQSSPTAFFGCGQRQPKEVSISWPDNNQSLQALNNAIGSTIVVSHPDLK